MTPPGYGRECEPRPWTPLRLLGCGSLLFVAVTAANLLLLPEVRWKSGGPAWLAEDRNGLQSIGLATLNRQTAEADPDAGAAIGATAGPAVPVAWQTALLPHLCYEPIHDAYDRLAAFDAPTNAAAAGTTVPEYLSRRPNVRDDTHRRDGLALSHLAGNVLVVGPGGGGIDAVPDGAANTLLAGQVGGGYRPWADPDNLRDAAAGFGRGTDQFGGPDGGAAFVVLCDGSVHRIDPSIDPQVFAALGTPDGGEAIGAE